MRTILASLILSVLYTGVALAQLYIANQGSNNLTVYDENGDESTVDVGMGPSNLALTPDGSHLYVANGGSNDLSVIQTSDNTVIDTIEVGNLPGDVAVSIGGDFVYVTLFQGNAVTVVDTTTNTVVGSPITVGNLPTAVAVGPDGKFIYVSNFVNVLGANNGTVSVIQTSDHTVVDTVEVGLLPNDLVVGPDNDFVYVVNSSSNSVSVIDTNTNMVVDTITVGEKPLSVANITSISGEPVDEIVVTNQMSGSISIINTTERKVSSTLSATGGGVNGVSTFLNAIFVTENTGDDNSGSYLRYGHNCNGQTELSLCGGDPAGTSSIGIVYTLANSDGDGVSSPADKDSDNDGISDDDETTEDSTTVLSAIGVSKGGLNDPDGDGIINSFDLDSDGDCIPDHFEAGGGNDSDRDGRSDNFVDVDMDGFHDEHDPDQTGNTLPIPDTDNDGIPDFLDSDSDNDGMTDAQEAGGLDQNGDGIHDELGDNNSPASFAFDGLADACHPDTGTPLPILDQNFNGVPDHLEGESNNGSSSCSIAAPGASPSIPLYLLIPAFILINRLWRRRIN